MIRIATASVELLLCGAAAPTAQVEPTLRILVTNDDGVSAQGIAALAEALRPMADVVVAACRRQFWPQPVADDLFAPAGG